VNDTGRLLARLAVFVATNATSSPLTARLCTGCQQLLGADSASITVEIMPANRVTVGSTDDVAATFEDLQEVTGEGPSLDAYTTGEAVITPLGQAAMDRWPLFVTAAREVAPDLTVYALPMRPGAATLGVVSLLRAPPGKLSEGLSSAQFLADAIGAALLRDPLSTAEYDMAGPWSHRTVIHQATGMVIAQLGVAAEDAIALLKAHAYAHGASLADVAGEVVDRALDFRPS
jgi:hypothetical protein